MKNVKQTAIYLVMRAIDVVTFFLSLLSPQRRSATLPLIDDSNIVTPAIELSNKIKSGHLKAEQVVESFIDRIKKVNPMINAMVVDRFHEALKEAREVDRKLAEARDGRGDRSLLDLPLIGVPISLKETIALEGYSLTCASLARKFIRADRNAKVVDLVLKAGMIVVGKTNLPEMSLWWDSSNLLFGRTNNPYDLSKIPGGSSGGEAALISAAGSLVGIGNDLAGSIRIPACFCGIFAHKPTPFVVSNEGSFPKIEGKRERSLGVGPMTRYACDLMPMLKVLAGTNVNKLNLDEPVDLSKIKLFYLEELGDPWAKSCNSDILKAMRKAVAHLTNKYKCPTNKVTFNEFKYGSFLWFAELNTSHDAFTMARQFKDLKGNKQLNPIIEFLKKIFQLSMHTLNAIAITILEKLNAKFGTKKHTILDNKCQLLRKKFNDLLDNDGVLLMPTHPEPAPNHSVTILKAFNISYTMVTTVLQCPITQCPLGLSRDGLPIGCQIIARAYNDRLTITVAQELEKVFGGWINPSY